MSILDAPSCGDGVRIGSGGSGRSRRSGGSRAAGSRFRPDREVPRRARPVPSPERCPSPSSSRCAALPGMLLGCRCFLGFFGRTPGAAFPTGLCAHLPTSWVTATISTHTASLASLSVAACRRLSPPAPSCHCRPDGCGRRPPVGAAAPVCRLGASVAFSSGAGRAPARDRRPEARLLISPRSPHLQAVCPLSSDQGPGTAMLGCSPPRTARVTL